MNNIQKGYKLVPVEPTEDMRLAFADQIRTGDYNPGTLVGDLCAGIYTAMLAAAPTPPQPIYDEAKELKRFRDWRRKTTRPECNYDPHRELIMSEAWLARAKAGEDE